MPIEDYGLTCAAMRRTIHHHSLFILPCSRRSTNNYLLSLLKMYPTTPSCSSRSSLRVQAVKPAPTS
jgi:hypothetical protein